jgi:hypothetical protein
MNITRSLRSRARVFEDLLQRETPQIEVHHPETGKTLRIRNLSIKAAGHNFS